MNMEDLKKYFIKPPSVEELNRELEKIKPYLNCLWTWHEHSRNSPNIYDLFELAQEHSRKCRCFYYGVVD